MSNELSQDDAQKLFNQISAADGDPLKLDELFKTPDTGEDPNANVDPSENQPNPHEDADGNKDGEQEGEGEQHQEGNPPDDSNPEGTPKVDEVPGQEPDELAKLREQLDKLGKENHALKSQAGRVPHVQRRLKELEQKLEELNQKASSPSNHPSATIKPKVLEQLKGIRETDPELADAVAKAIEQATSEVATDAINRQREQLTLLRDQERAAYNAEQVSLLLEMVPNAKDVVASPQWSEWKNAQPDVVVRLAESDDAQSVALAMRLYAEHMKAKYPQLAAPAENKQVAKPSDEDAAKAAKIEQERLARQQKAANVGSPAAQGKVSLPDDPEALFKKFSDEIRKNM